MCRNLEYWAMKYAMMDPMFTTISQWFGLCGGGFGKVQDPQGASSYLWRCDIRMLDLCVCQPLHFAVPGGHSRSS